jgi:hypothetical protein
MWAVFESPDKEPWAASFRAGDVVPYRAAHVVDTTNDAVIVSGGYAYWLSLEDRAVRYEHDFVEYSVPVPMRPQVVASTFTELYVLSPQGVQWCSDRIALDGLTIAEVTTRYVRGEAPGYSGAVPFVLDLETMHLQGGQDSWRQRR